MIKNQDKKEEIKRSDIACKPLLSRLRGDSRFIRLLVSGVCLWSQNNLFHRNIIRLAMALHGRLYATARLLAG
ncbi:MAG TPA: hypothetical protein DCF88_11010 [Plesiomonas shigelloides]|nr:hypothetical protein [Plesiomonas shigelloides]